MKSSLYINQIIIVCVCVLFITVVGFIDYITGFEISFSIFYLIPVAFASWHTNSKVGIVISVVCALTWFQFDTVPEHIYSNASIPVWNALVRLVFFLVVVGYVSKYKINIELHKRLSNLDYLTGIANKRSFYEFLHREINRCRKNSQPLTIAYIDCDNFKKVNDTLGHNIGDELLKVVSSTTQNYLRITDMVARLGGDEFVIVLPETNQQHAMQILTRVKEALLDKMTSHSWPVTFSIGAITFTQMLSADEMIKEADNLMYSAKQAGKNIIKHKIA
ncbi:MAG: GGDEF domain-containing protein [Blastocatellia bacterium]